MWVTDKFVKKKKISRKGVANSVSILQDKDILGKKCTLKILKKSNSLSIVDGNLSTIITDEIGFSSTVEFSVFFVDDGMILFLHKGNLYVHDSKNKILVVTNKGTVRENGKESLNVIWKSVEQVKSLVSTYVSGKYNLYSIVDKNKYISNAMFKVSASYRHGDKKLFIFNVLEMNTDLALGEFEFEAKEAMAAKPVVYYDEEESKYNGGKRKGKDKNDKNDIDKYVEEDSNVEDDSLDLEIYKNYISETTDDYD